MKMSREMRSFNKNELKKVLDFAIRLAYEAGDLLIKYEKKIDRLKITYKGVQGVASSADFQSEKLITSRIKRNFPQHLILSEEMSFLKGESSFSNYQNHPFTWIVDPLDGTNNFLSGFNYYAVCIGLSYFGEPILGVVYRPSTGEVFAAHKSGGAKFFNRHKGGQNRSFYVPQNKKRLHETLLVTCSFNQSEEQKAKDFRSYQRLMESSRSIRKLGSAALEFCYVGKGIFDGIWEKGLAPWDLAAPAIVCQEAGVYVTGPHGEKFSPYCNEVLAARRPLYHKLKKIIDC